MRKLLVFTFTFVNFGHKTKWPVLTEICCPHHADGASLSLPAGPSVCVLSPIAWCQRDKSLRGLTSHVGDVWSLWLVSSRHGALWLADTWWCMVTISPGWHRQVTDIRPWLPQIVTRLRGFKCWIFAQIHVVTLYYVERDTSNVWNFSSNYFQYGLYSPWLSTGLIPRAPIPALSRAQTDFCQNPSCINQLLSVADELVSIRNRAS